MCMCVWILEHVCVCVCVFVSVDSPKFVWYCHSYSTHVLCAIASANAGEGDLRLHCWGGWWVRLQGRRNYWGPRLQWLFLVQGTFVRQSGPVSSQLHIPSWRDQMRVLSDEHLTMSRLPSVLLTKKNTCKPEDCYLVSVIERLMYMWIQDFTRNETERNDRDSNGNLNSPSTNFSQVHMYLPFFCAIWWDILMYGLIEMNGKRYILKVVMAFLICNKK